MTPNMDTKAIIHLSQDDLAEESPHKGIPGAVSVDELLLGYLSPMT